MSRRRPYVVSDVMHRGVITVRRTTAIVSISARGTSALVYHLDRGAIEAPPMFADLEKDGTQDSSCSPRTAISLRSRSTSPRLRTSHARVAR